MVYLSVTVIALAASGLALFAIIDLGGAFGGKTWPVPAAGLLLVAGSLRAVIWRFSRAFG